MVVTDATLLRRHLFLLIMLWRLTTTLFRRSVIVILNLNRNIVRPQPLQNVTSPHPRPVWTHMKLNKDAEVESRASCYTQKSAVAFAMAPNCVWLKLHMNMQVNSVSCCCERCSQSGKGSNVSANFNMPTCNFHDMPCHRCISLLSNVWKYGLNRLFSPAQGYNDMEWDMVRWPGDHLDSSKRKFMSHQTPWRLVCATELAWNGSSALSW